MPGMMPAPATVTAVINHDYMYHDLSSVLLQELKLPNGAIRSKPPISLASTALHQIPFFAPHYGPTFRVADDLIAISRWRSDTRRKEDQCRKRTTNVVSILMTMARTFFCESYLQAWVRTTATMMVILTMPAATLTPVAAVGSHPHNANRDSTSLAVALPAQPCSRPTSCTSAGEPGK